MDIILLGITIVSLVVALVMSVAAWRLMRDEKQRSAARVAALSVAANVPDPLEAFSTQSREAEFTPRPVSKAPWGRAPFDSADSAPSKSVSLRAAAAPLAPPELPLNQTQRSESYVGQAASTHASGFLGATELPRDNGSRQKSLAFAAVILFVVMSGGLVWMMSGPEGTSATAVGPNSPLELVSLTHARQNEKLAVSGLVRNPLNGKPVDRLSAVVFLFDRTGTFVASSRANVDFLKLGAGDESPFVVSLDAPATVARYRVSFRTDDGIVPHVDRRGEPETAGSQESTVKSSVVSQQ